MWEQCFAWPGDGPYPTEVDVVVLEDVGRTGVAPSEAVRFAYALLREGGTLLFCLTPEEIGTLGLALEAEALNLWLRALNFHLLNVEVVKVPKAGKAPHCVLHTRKRVRTIAEVVDEGYRGLNVNCPDVKAFVDALPEGM